MKWFTRFPQKVIDPIYLNNMIEATKLFINWFRNIISNFSYSSTEYAAMLSKMHKIVSNGYSGYTHSNGPLIENNDFRDATGWNPVLQKSWFVDIPDTLIIRPALKYILSDQSHWLENLGENYILHLPDAKYVPYYLGILAKLMNEMRWAYFHQKELDLVNLANYMQLFVVGHPFKKINFSICMAQINAILYLNQYKYLYHEYMDFACFVYNYNIIEDMFVGRVRGY